MEKSRSTLIALCLVSVALRGIAADSPCNDPCRTPTSWFDFNQFVLKVTSPDSKGYGLWHGQWDVNSNDMQIDSEMNYGNKPKIGKILMISGRVMAVKGEVGKPGFEMDALDSAVMQQQLVLRLLGAALPNGTKKLTGTHKIDFADTKTGIQFATPSAQGFISPPWIVKGTVKLVTHDVVDYDLALSSGLKGQSTLQDTRYSANFSGRLSKSSKAKLDDAMRLDSWTILGVGVQSKKTKDGTTYDYTSAPSATVYKTVSDIRKKLENDNYPGAHDATKNFTGFWKSKCEDAFGLQIKPYGTDGKYSIVFCGPGGCGNVDEGRKTFITGDKNFEVVSEDEIFEIDSSGKKDRNLRCTKEPNPILKY